MMVVTMSVWFYVVLENAFVRLDAVVDNLEAVLDLLPSLFPNIRDLVTALEDIPRAARIACWYHFWADGG
jgi:hypothetical protein